MAENVIHGFSFAKGKGFTPYSGDGGADVVPFDGLVAVALSGSNTYTARRNDRGETPPMIRVNGIIQDEDGSGLKLISNLHLDGSDRNGEWMGRQFLELMCSFGTTAENINKMAEADTKMPDANGVIAKFMAEKRVGYAEIEADVYEGKETTRLKNWISKERYEQAKVLGAHRKKRRTVGVAAPAGASVTNLGGSNGVSGPAAGASSAPML